MNESVRTPLIGVVILLLAFLLGRFLMRDAVESGAAVEAKPKKTIVQTTDDNWVAPKANNGPRKRSDPYEEINETISAPNERLVTFKNEDAYRRALGILGQSGFKNLGQLDRIRTIRVGFGDNLSESELRNLLGEEAEYNRNFLSVIPRRPEVEDQPNAVPFGSNYLEFLGIEGDNSNFGEGVKVAILDSGVSEHIGLQGKIAQQVNISELGEGAEQHGHGTAVTGLVSGTNPRVPGLSPGAEILPYRVTDENGTSNDFYLLDAIGQAMDQGADFIVISLGGYGYNPLMQAMITEAYNAGIAIVAAAGNDGFPAPAFPGGYENAYAVGATDANGNHLNFSNQGETLNFVGPGKGLNVLWPGDNVATVDGTSFSTPLAAAAGAAIISESGEPLTGVEAMDLLSQFSDEAGRPGPDEQFGNGIFNPGRVLWQDQPDINDLAIAPPYYQLPTAEDSSSGLLLTVENRGTTTSQPTTVNLQVADGLYPVTVNSLRPNEAKVLNLPVGLEKFRQEGVLDVRSSFSSSQPNEVNLRNNSRTDQFTLPGFAEQQ